jgi:NDP-sugar pyrophosphorylase family protein
MKNLTYDFGDWYGKVPVHYHKNPDGRKGGLVADSAEIGKNVTIGKGTKIASYVKIGRCVIIGADSYIGVDVVIGAYSQIGKNVVINSYIYIGFFVNIGAGLKVEKEKYIIIERVGSRYAPLFVVLSPELYFCTGCFSGNKEEFIQAIEERHSGTRYETQYKAAIEFVEKLAESIEE